MTRTIGLLFTLAGSAALAWGYRMGGYALLAAALLGFGLLWLVSQWQRWNWFSVLGLAIPPAAAAAGLWLNLPAVWMVAGVLGGLLGWDLAEFNRRLEYAAPTDDLPTLERRHLAWLGIPLGAGLLLTAAAMLARLQFSFAWTVFLAVTAILGLIQLSSWLLYKEND